MRNGTLDLVWVMSHMGMRHELCAHGNSHSWIKPIIRGYGMALLTWYEACHTWEWAMYTCERVMSHVRTSHSALVNHAYNKRTWNGTLDLVWVMSHMGMRHELCTHGNASCHTWKWVMSHVGTSLVTHGNEWVISQMGIRHRSIP